LFFFQRDHRPELIRPNLIKVDSDAHLQRRPESERATEQ
jgi:hypothetical protein